MEESPIFSSCKQNASFAGVLDIDPRELLQKCDQVFIADVRQPDEFSGELGHIPGAKLFVLDRLPEHLPTFPKDKPIVFVCRSGGRSAKASAYALESGFAKVFNLEGGMLAWNELHFTIEK